MKLKQYDVRSVHTCTITGRKFYQVVVSYGACARVKKVWID